jgi:hypothetical protein
MELQNPQSDKKTKTIKRNITFALSETGGEDVLLVVKNRVYNPNYGKHSSQNENTYLLRNDAGGDWRKKNTEIAPSLNDLDKNTIDCQATLAIIAVKNYLKADDFSSIKTALQYATEKISAQSFSVSSKALESAKINLALACAKKYQVIITNIDTIKEANNYYLCDECNKDNIDRVEWHGCDKKKLDALKNAKQATKNVWGYLLQNRLVPEDEQVKKAVCDINSWSTAYAQTKGIRVLAETKAKPERLALWKQVQEESQKIEAQKKS